MAFLVKVSDVTGDDFWTAHGGKYPFLTAAKKAGDFVWQTFQKNEQYVGGTIDNNNIQDKEAGTLSLEGYLALYENTKLTKWLDRAKAAYKDIAAMLLHNTKNMVALPGRLWDLYEPGALQEHWGISSGRGQARHRGALPWVTVNHITGIFGLKDIDMDLFNEIAGAEKTRTKK